MEILQHGCGGQRRSPEWSARSQPCQRPERQSTKCAVPAPGRDPLRCGSFGASPGSCSSLCTPLEGFPVPRRCCMRMPVSSCTATLSAPRVRGRRAQAGPAPDGRWERAGTGGRVAAMCSRASAPLWQRPPGIAATGTDPCSSMRRACVCRLWGPAAAECEHIMKLAEPSMARSGWVLLRAAPRCAAVWRIAPLSDAMTCNVTGLACSLAWPGRLHAAAYCCAAPSPLPASSAAHTPCRSVASAAGPGGDGAAQEPCSVEAAMPPACPSSQRRGHQDRRVQGGQRANQQGASARPAMTRALPVRWRQLAPRCGAVLRYSRWQGCGTSAR